MSESRHAPREVLVFDRDGVFRPADYPWLTHVVAHLRGGVAAPADGASGDGGYVLLELHGPPGSTTEEP